MNGEFRQKRSAIDGRRGVGGAATILNNISSRSVVAASLRNPTKPPV